MNLRAVALGLILAVLTGAGVARSGDAEPVVVELFTSQGCSSCPPADNLMAELSEREDVIALALHVDYWDYIGWKDEYADPAYTRRQKNYARAAGHTSVYTPQMVINGQDHVVGTRAMKLADLITLHKQASARVELDVTRSGDAVSIQARHLAEPPAIPLQVQLVRFMPERVAQITRGENAGRTIRYVNVVESWEPLGDWDPSGDLSLELEITGDLPAVVLLQEPGPGAILAARRLN